MEIMKVRLTLIEKMLGTSPNNPEIYKEFFAAKAPNEATAEEELETLPTDGEKGMTVFGRRIEDGRPFLYDYHIKGFFKDSCQMLARLKNSGNESSKIKAYKKIIDGLIFPAPREIPIIFEGECGVCQRPLRAQTLQGERVALAMSETVPAGATMEFTIKVLDAALLPAVREWLDYGELRGLGQWRNSGCGRMVWDELDAEGNVIGGNNAYLKTRE